MFTAQHVTCPKCGRKVPIRIRFDRIVIVQHLYSPPGNQPAKVCNGTGHHVTASEVQNCTTS